ncbi:hypothetical protein DFH08DRAFT_811829 [Mycena albidolilacea]|uniref:Uncharacterized protein n=1 Tax=Mycena albidolilacea TaxID=1033008 RepID=A0AAD6ZUQ3_9AGAR|nr:hypothetical protein DFH08DRAFT_811829 [Mycena albidolilacea]
MTDRTPRNTRKSSRVLTVESQGRITHHAAGPASEVAVEDKREKVGTGAHKNFDGPVFGTITENYLTGDFRELTSTNGKWKNSKRRADWGQSEVVKKGDEERREFCACKIPRIAVTKEGKSQRIMEDLQVSGRAAVSSGDVLTLESKS